MTERCDAQLRSKVKVWYCSKPPHKVTETYWGAHTWHRDGDSDVSWTSRRKVRTVR